MRPYLFFLILYSIATVAFTQGRQSDTSHYRNVPIPAHLLPVERAYGSSSLGSVYYYGGKKLSSPFALEVPFFELDDPTVTHHFRSFRTLTTLSRLTSVATLAYVLFSKDGSNSTYWVVYGSSIVASLTFTIIGNGQVNKAVTRYNELLRQPRIGVSVAPVSLTGQMAVGAGVGWKF